MGQQVVDCDDAGVFRDNLCLRVSVCKDRGSADMDDSSGPKAGGPTQPSPSPSSSSPRPNHRTPTKATQARGDRNGNGTFEDPHGRPRNEEDDGM